MVEDEEGSREILSGAEYAFAQERYVGSLFGYGDNWRTVFRSSYESIDRGAFQKMQFPKGISLKKIASASQRFALALDTDDSLWIWGYS